MALCRRHPSLVRGLGFPADPVRLGRRIPGREADAGPLAAARLGLAVAGPSSPTRSTCPGTRPRACPAASPPEGLPVGLQIVGRRFDDLGVLQASAAFEQVQPWADKRPDSGPDARMRSAINAFLLGFPALFSIVNPISGAFIFRSVTASRPQEDHARLARRVALNSLVVMMVALWAGSYVLAFFGISLAALRVAGGLVVALSAWGLLTNARNNTRPKAGAGRPRRGRRGHRAVPADHPDHHRPGHDLRRGDVGRQPPAGVARARLVLHRHDGAALRWRDDLGRLSVQPIGFPRLMGPTAAAR